MGNRSLEVSGLELGEPHRHASACANVLRSGQFDRVLGSLHTLPDRGGFAEPWGIYPHADAHEVVRDYLAGVSTLVAESDLFEVLAHIDYPVRSWPTERAGPFDPAAFEGEFRDALRATAQSGRALEVNTRLPLQGIILTWWHEEGGDAITFGSDAHTPSFVGHGFAEAAHMAEAHGFQPGRHLYDLWGRVN
ncbi:hypothetical protein AB0M46_38090 [Dactylosporangium sp. NPDC051485]|uniref:hypothetical protein n=1 Tax=Dactylosporangium sp. NPDC051485 TaxID=3154846 RepID=UPI003435AD02